MLVRFNDNVLDITWEGPVKSVDSVDDILIELVVWFDGNISVGPIDGI